MITFNVIVIDYICAAITPCQPVCHIVVVMPSVVGQQWLAFSGLIAEKFPKILP